MGGLSEKLQLDLYLNYRKLESKRKKIVNT